MKKIILTLLLALIFSLTALSYMGGYEDGTFRPDNTMTRAEAVTVMARLMTDSIPEKDTSFSDVKGHWSKSYVAYLEGEGLLGYYKNEFSPDKPITRAEFVALAVNIFDLEEKKSNVAFKDVKENHPFYKEIIRSAKCNLVGGYEDGTFRPDGTITRAEAVTVINRALKIDVNSNVFGQNYNKVNKFSDIAGHWARYNIIISSTKDAQNYFTPIFGNIYFGGIHMKDNRITLENSYFSYVIDTSGSLVSLYDKAGNKEMLGSINAFLYAQKNGVRIYPDRVTLDNSKLVFTMEDSSYVILTPTVKDAYIAFEISDVSDDLESVSFCNTVLDYEIESDEDTSVLGISLSSLAITHNSPKITTRSYLATAYRHFGIKGAKYAIIATPVKYHLSALEALAKDTDIKSGIFGASRFDSEEKRLVNTNYFLGHDGNHETLFDSLPLYTAVGIDMLSFHKGDGTFRQGDFYFHNQNLKTAFKSVLDAYINMAGIKSPKSYSYYMTPEGSKTLNAQLTKEFKYIGSYKLSEKISKSAKEIPLENFDLTGEYYIVINDELIKAEFESGKTVSSSRKQGGTKRGEHLAGDTAVIIDITGSGAHNFKALVSDKLREKGILSGLHTYAFYIDPECQEILSDPKWQKQLEIGEEYTLAADIDESTSVLPTLESLENAERTIGFRPRVWDLVLIGDELIKINVDRIGDKEFKSVLRGYHGTKITSHKAGEKIRRIGAYYGGLAPKMGSELFYHIAKLTGEAYNDGGFDMVYFDAIDGVSVHVDSNTYPDSYAYYTTEFIRATLEYCHDKPITEVYIPTQYITHSYTPAYDYANRGYKEYIKAHSEFNQTYLNSYFFATLGWYNFYPQNTPANTVYEYQHTDDIDMLGTTAVAYDYSMVFSNLETYNTIPKNKANIDRYVEYDTLRKKGYFQEDIKKALREGEWEYSLVKKSDGSYSFFEKSYTKARINNLADSDLNFIEGENPFKSQTPFIRIEGDWSSVGENEITVLEQNKTPERTNVTFDTPFNASGRHAMTVTVASEGGNGAICISLDSPVVSDRNQIDYVIPLNFKGTKNFTFVATDTFLYPMEYFPHWSTRYTYDFKIYRGPVDFSSISSINIYTYGDVSKAKISDIKLAKEVNSPIVNPTVTLESGEKITFNCTINSGEYLEFDGKTALVYDSVGNSKKVSFNGNITVKEGEFKANLTAESSDILMRGKLTFGFTGDEVK